ncbi:hypothetical protein DBZ36_15970 [Alginatibacterium sediminis]|uniref:Kazal-like domain-containing protein n=1 Tax=Alginatibacterium sediminis TaxID=2164068 RepID=A0A420E8S6_9ALTE|nr:hypothetical protein [Alginatibacterium sediminis]RKF15866.1 hypothetical protein DBZ36_15970 [Alginatibacterium sediminis]
MSISKGLLTSLTFSAVFALSACSTQEPMQDKAAPSSAEIIVCPSERPEMCTMEYAPVCANVDGNREEFANGCGACSNPDVESYTPGACE